MDFLTLQKKASLLGIEEIEMYSQKRTGLDLDFFDGEMDSNTTKMIDVVCVRGVYNHHIATVYTEKNTDAAIDLVLNSIIKNATLISKDEPYFIYEGDEKYPVVEEPEMDFDKGSTSIKIQLCQKLDAMIKEKCPYVYKTECSFSEDSYENTLQNSKGLNLTKTGKKAFLVCQLVAKKGDDVKTNYDYLQIKNMKDIDLEKFADKLIADTIDQFGAEPVSSKEYDVVLDKSAVRSLLQVYSSVFCADNVLKKVSFLEGKIGEKIFGDNVTIYDDPLNELALNRDTFDDEGVATKTKVVVENGVLKAYLNNLSTAKMMNQEPTGNGYKASISSPVGVSISNFYLRPGKATLTEMFEYVKNGLYITSLSGLHAGVNQISGNYSLQASGFQIIDGKKADPVTLIILSSSFQDTMNKIAMIGNDFEFRGSVGASSIVVKNLSVSGKE